MPITSFRTDSATDAARDTTHRPAWFGLQASPIVGGSDPSGRQSWNADGTPWVALSGAWPFSPVNEAWVALGYEHWKYTLRSTSVPLGDIVLPYVNNPLELNQFTARFGIDQLIVPDRGVSGAFGLGFGTGYGVSNIGEPAGRSFPFNFYELAFDDRRYIPFEFLAHALVYFRAAETMRIGAGVSGGPTWLLMNKNFTEPVFHWELALRLEQSMSRR
jgi:hypothetical protein